MNNCCPDEVSILAPTSLRAFTVGNNLHLSVNNKSTVIDLSDLIGTTVSENTYFVPVTSNGQTTFIDAFPSGETFLSLVIGIEHQVNVDFTVVNQTIVWTSAIELEIGDILIIRTQKIIE